MNSNFVRQMCSILLFFLLNESWCVKSICHKMGGSYIIIDIIYIFQRLKNPQNSHRKESHVFYKQKMRHF